MREAGAIENVSYWLKLALRMSKGVIRIMPGTVDGWAVLLFGVSLFESPLFRFGGAAA